MLDRFLRELGFRDHVVLLNTVGDAASRAAYRQALVEFLAPHREALGADSRRRLETNPLRILDTKSDQERRLLEGAPSLSDHLTPEAREHFATVCGLLERFGIAHRVDERLVRGLDYYTDTVFEVAAQGLGAQDAILGGGRYDDLVGQLGGPRIPGIGFAIGEDRLLDVVPEAFRKRSVPAPALLVVPVGEVPAAEVLSLCEEIRQGGRRCLGELTGRSLKANLKRADRLGARYVLILGEEELASGSVTVRDLAAGTQRRVSRSDLEAELGKEGR
jgi:histidyl-tRNA synthetase